MKTMVMGPRKIISGADSLNFIEKIEAKRVFIVTSAHALFANGTVSCLEKILHAKNCETKIFSDVSQNPDVNVVLAGVQAMRTFVPDTVIAAGGGSPIDAAKVMTLLYEYPQLNLTAILDRPLPDKRNKTQLIAIPSTSGTASEVTKAAVITFSQLKIGLKSEAFLPDVAILDPKITLSMPPKIVAETGMDALTHAVECYINKNSDDFSDALAKEAILGIVEYLPRSYRENSIENREKMHNYQCMAGLAFSNVGLGAAHGISHAIGGMYNLGHGLLNAVALPYVLTYNSRDAWVKQRIAMLSKEVGSDFIRCIESLIAELHIPATFKGCGIGEDDFYTKLDRLTANALKGSTRVNPYPFDEDSMKKLLTAMYEGKQQ